MKETRTDSGAVSPGKKKHAIHFTMVNSIVVAMALVFALGLFLVAYAVGQAIAAMQEITENYIVCESATVDMENASVYLTAQARMFVLTQDPTYLRRYLIEDNDTMRREHAIETLNKHSEDEEAAYYLKGALKKSEDLEVNEHYAMKLVVVASSTPASKGADGLDSIILKPADAKLSDEAKMAKAYDIMFDERYQDERDFIDRMVDECRDKLVSNTQEAQAEIQAQLNRLLLVQSILAILLIVVVSGTIVLYVVLIKRPMRSYTAHMDQGEPLELAGSAELQKLARSYNALFEENARQNARLLYEAEHDSLTGLLNRSGFEKIYREVSGERALLLIDVDFFKRINDEFGHDVGDEVLRAVGSALGETFGVDCSGRIGGDEFAAIMPDANSSMRDSVEERIESLVGALGKTEGLPKSVTLSIGSAFDEDAAEDRSLYKAADLALYHVKNTSRNGYAFYSDIANDGHE